MVRLKSHEERKKSAEDVIAEARQRVQREVPEARVEFVQVLQDVLNDLSGTPRPIEIKLFGSDYAGLQAKAREVAESRGGGARTGRPLRRCRGRGAASSSLRLDASDAARFGLTAAEVTADLDAALHGTVASVIRRPDRPVGVRVRYPDAVRFDAKQLEQLPLLPAAGGGTTSIAAVARFERTTAPQRSPAREPSSDRGRNGRSRVA